MIHIFNKKYSLYLLLFVALYFIFFQHLSSYHIRNWDESMFAVNAYEMSINHNYIVPFYKNTADMWNSKPPMQIWAQVLFIKLIGFNELAIRLPSALASSFSALLLFYFFKKRTSLIFSICVFFVFITSAGVSSFHTGRTGDSDALLSFFILCYCIAFYKWLIEDKSIAILHFFIFLTLAVLTKSIAALIFLPAILFLIFYFKKLKTALTDKWFYFGFLFFSVIVFGYFFLRDYYQNGYINYVLHNDIGRINNVIELHKEPFDFYLNNLFEYRFIWLILVLPGAFAMFLNSKTKSSAIFLGVLFTTYFLIISYSKTKLEWYDLPLFPILSILSAYFIYVFIKKIYVQVSVIHIALILFFIFSLPLYFSCRSAYKSEIYEGEKKLEILTEYAFKNFDNSSLNNSIFLTTTYDRGLSFYKYKLNTKGLDFKITQSIENINNNSIVIVANDSLKSALIKKFDVQIIDSVKTALKLKITGIK